MAMAEKPKFFLLLIALLILIVTFPIAALADTWIHYTEITVEDTSGTDRTGVPVLISISGQNLLDAGNINATGTNTRMLESTTARDYLMATTRTALLIPNLVSLQERTYKLYTGYSPLATEFGLIIGSDNTTTAGVLVADAPVLELSDGFDIEIKGWVNTSMTGVPKRLMYKQNAWMIYVQAASTIRAAILGGGDAEVLVATTPATVTSGEHTIRVTADGVNLKIYIDAVEEASTALAGNTVPDNGNSWYFMQNDCLPYVEYITIEATDW